MYRALQVACALATTSLAIVSMSDAVAVPDSLYWSLHDAREKMLVEESELKHDVDELKKDIAELQRKLEEKYDKLATKLLKLDKLVAAIRQLERSM